MTSEPADRGAPGRLGSASLFCERCGTVTEHRIFRVRRGTPGSSGGFGGVARCRECRWTHPFEALPEARRSLDVIVSDGERSTRETWAAPRDQRVEVGSELPGFRERVVVRRIDPVAGPPVPSAVAGEVATVWATRDAGAVVRVSRIEGARTVPGRLVVPPETVFEVGGAFRFEQERLIVVALRARGHTWRRPGDRFRAADVQRVYARRTESPPAGSSPWRTGRVTPRSRTSSNSRADRSRSSPGVRRNRTSPRARTEASGATVHRSSPR